MTSSDDPIGPETLLEHAGWMKTLARALVIDESRAEDVLQDTWLRVLEHPPRHGRGIRSWIATVLRNTARRTRRDAKRRERRDRIASRPELVDLSPEQLLERAEIHRRLVDLVVGLEEPYRSTVLLRFFEGLSTREISRLQGAPVATVRTRILRALGLLRAALDRAHGRREAWCSILATFAGAGAASGLGSGAQAAAGRAGSLGNPSTGGVLMALGSKTALATATAALLVTTLVLGVKLSDARRENARLDELVVSREPPRTDDRLSRAPGPSTGQAAAAPAGGRTVLDTQALERLASKAIVAYEERDPRAFNQAFFGLIDLGPPAYEMLCHILRSTTGDSSVRSGRLGQEFQSGFNRELQRRSADMPPLLDAILSRPGRPDSANLFALHLMEFYGIESGRPPGEHARALLDVMAGCLEGAGDFERDWIFGWTARRLGKLRLPAMLPELERMTLEPAASDRARAALFGAMADVGGRAGVEAMERTFESAPEFLRPDMLRGVGRTEDELVREFLRRASAGREDRDLRRMELRQALHDPERLAEVVDRLRGEELGAEDRLDIIGVLYTSRNPEHLEPAWEAFQRLDPRSQESALEWLVPREPRAVDLLLETLSASEEGASDSVRAACRQLDSRVVREHEEAFRRIAGRHDLPLETRAAAAGSLVKVDPRAAVDAVTAGFTSLDERARRQIVSWLRNDLNCDEAKVYLEAVAANDAAESVRQSAGAR